MQPFDIYTAAEVFTLSKKIYSRRSDLAHGKPGIDKSRYYDNNRTNVKVLVEDVVLALLSHALIFFCSHNEFLDSQKSRYVPA